jgi:two-component system LytT family response regulator
MKIAIVDDSRLARAELRDMLSGLPNAELAGEAANADEARALIEAHKPDLVLLDIHMPGKDGFALLDELDHVPAVIFVTAYDEFALRAFEVNALDYLLKPVTPERLQRALAKFDAPPDAAEESTGAPRVRGRGERIFLREGERCWFVRLADVRLLSVEGNYTRVHFGKEKPLLARSLQYLEARLDPGVFFRVNRQQIVNLDWIERVDPWIGDGLRVVLKDGSEIEVSRRQARELREMMEI